MKKEVLTATSLKFVWRLSLSYFIVASAWILISDSLLLVLFSGDSESTGLASIVKGMGFVLVTTALLMLFSHRELRRRDALEESLWFRDIQLEQVIAQLPVAMLHVDRHLSVEAIHGRQDVIPAQLRVAVHESLEATFTSGSPVLTAHQKANSGGVDKLEFEADGLVYRLDVVPLFNRANQIVGSLSMWLDVTEQRRIYAQLEELNQQLEHRIQQRTQDLELANRRLQHAVAERAQKEEQVQHLNDELQQRAAMLEAVNDELRAFSYSVSHDLKAPLRRITGFSEALMADYATNLAPEAIDFLDRISHSVAHMNALIEDLLKLSRVSQHVVKRTTVNLSTIATSVIADLQVSEPSRQVDVDIEPELTASCDEGLMHIVLDNLLRNAWKFTSPKDQEAAIVFGQVADVPREVFFVRDNGVGFDMAHADRLFVAFQRLHKTNEFPGTGIGLATVRRIINQHQGWIWAESTPGEGTTFYFTLSRG